MGVIVFSPNYAQNQAKDQTGKHPFDPSMTYTVENMAAVLIAAGGSDQRIGAAVGAEPAVVDMGSVFQSAILGTGLLKMPLPRPHNASYHDANELKAKLISEDPCQQYVEVVDSVHTSHSCSDPHMTIYIKTAKHQAIGQKIHICVKPDGVKWAFDKVHA